MITKYPLIDKNYRKEKEKRDKEAPNTISNIRKTNEYFTNMIIKPVEDNLKDYEREILIQQNEANK